MTPKEIAMRELQTIKARMTALPNTPIQSADLTAYGSNEAQANVLIESAFEWALTLVDDDVREICHEISRIKLKRLIAD